MSIVMRTLDRWPGANVNKRLNINQAMKKLFAALPMALWVISGGAAIARPYVYIASFPYGAPATKCLESAESTLKKFKFTEDPWRDYSPKENDKVGRVYGTHEDSATRAVIYCNQIEGITSLAVGGLDNEATWDLYKKLFDTLW